MQQPDPSTPALDGRLLDLIDMPAEERSRIAALGATPEGFGTLARALARTALADRIGSACTLAAGVAHELNSPLAYVTANLSFLADAAARVVAILSGEPPDPRDVELASQVRDAMCEARSGADRMRTVVRDLETFARGERERHVPVELAPVLDSCLNLAWNEIRKRARVARDLAPVPPVVGNEARLAQLFLNLLMNAAQAIPEGRPDDHEVRITTRSLPGGRVAVEVRDTGCGIAAADRSRIFDPFFTTKPPGSGTGLGLSICHAVVASMGGEMEVESAVGAGSTFRVVLAAAAPPSGAPEAARPPLAAGARGRILVVDDEPLVRAALRRTLAEHEVTAVESSQAALALLLAGERYDVVLSDLLMPGMNGMDLYRTLAARDAALARRVVFLTGGAAAPSAREFLEREKVAWIEKPFEVEALRQLVAQRIAAAAAAP